jgi:hypothetical protein
MPQFIALAVVGAGLYAGYRWLARAAQEIAAQLKRLEAELEPQAGRVAEKDMGDLEYDAVSGVYRPKRH